jgi:glutathione S-transferase
MTDQVQFYTHPMSRGQIARWMLEEVDAPYEAHLLDYATSMKADDYLAINPMGKVPAIVHKGHVVTECAAICAYLWPKRSRWLALRPGTRKRPTIIVGCSLPPGRWKAR